MLNRLRALLIISLFAFGSIGLAACGSDACEDAADKIAECTNQSAPSVEGECSGRAECLANCVNAASCDDITKPDPNSAYSKCVLSCTGQQ